MNIWTPQNIVKNDPSSFLCKNWKLISITNWIILLTVSQISLAVLYHSFLFEIKFSVWNIFFNKSKSSDIVQEFLGYILTTDWMSLIKVCLLHWSQSHPGLDNLSIACLRCWGKVRYLEARSVDVLQIYGKLDLHLRFWLFYSIVMIGRG